MTNIDVKQIRIAKRYSEALISDVSSNDEFQEILKDLKFVQETLISSPDLREFLENPVITNSDKDDVIGQIFNGKVSQKVLNLLSLLVENLRFNVFDGILTEYSNKLDQINNIVQAKIISAVALNDEAKEKLIQKLENKISKKIKAEYEINSDIIAGLVIEINDKTIDTSLKTKLNSIKKQLI